MSDVDNQARLSCTACRKQKRKCSRDLPSCLLCRRMRRACEYPSEYHIESSTRFTPSGTQQLVNADTFPALYFLDSYIFQRRGGKVQIPEICLPEEFLESLGSTTKLHNDIELYFSSTHNYFPIIYKRFIHHKIPASVEQLNADIGLLLLAMQMFCRTIDSNTGAEFYQQVKSCYTYVQCHNILSLATLQAGLLIALFEISQAIYPAAYLSMGNCARLGHALGIHNMKSAPQMHQIIGSWVEVEEIRRVWWGVIILDRYVNIGICKLPFACDDARPSDLLPTNESSWEKGEPTVIESLAVSESSTITASPFARSCQASHLLSLVIRHINEKGTDAIFHYQQAMAIHRTIYAFGAAVSQEIGEWNEALPDSSVQISLYTGMAVCYSAQLTLYDMYTCAEADDKGGAGIREQLEMQNIALVTIKEVCTSIHKFGKRIASTITSEGLSRISPLVCECLYRAALNYGWYIRETGSDELLQNLTDIKSVLEMIGRKWAIGRKYLDILDGEFDY
ncbi:hypothetical protein F5884DRAFT_794764 [Xylogone sp. PMI_703]|nr:hypothetical protein F5884DRAFT_794764 [Xylogone sp. PMI_703]